MSAAGHWIALDEAVSRLLPAADVRRARERFAHRSAALTDIYVAHISKAIDDRAADGGNVTRRLRELQLTHHALTAALSCAWDSNSPDARKR